MVFKMIENEMYLSISNEKIDLNKLYNFLENHSHGAVSTFIGRIRNSNFGKKVVGVSYDVFEPLAIKNFQNICELAKNQYEDNSIKFYIEHFNGNLNVGEISIVIGVSATHRAEAIDACRFIIEEIKHSSPIWKQEHYENKSSEWIKGHALCKREKAVNNYIGKYHEK
jgi:molybdopterin synthase catalytic subunit